MCPSCPGVSADDVDAEHVFFTCPRFDLLRSTWAEAITKKIQSVFDRSYVFIGGSMAADKRFCDGSSSGIPSVGKKAVGKENPLYQHDGRAVARASFTK